MQATRETTLYAKGKTQVTPVNVVHGSFTIPVANIKSVRTQHRRPNRLIGFIVGIVGVALAIIGYIVWHTLLTPVFAGMVLAVVGVVLYVTARERFTVRLNTSVGKDAVLRVTDQATADEVAAAINQARASV